MDDMKDHNSKLIASAICYFIFSVILAIIGLYLNNFVGGILFTFGVCAAILVIIVCPQPIER